MTHSFSPLLAHPRSQRDRYDTIATDIPTISKQHFRQVQILRLWLTWFIYLLTPRLLLEEAVKQQQQQQQHGSHYCYGSRCCSPGFGWYWFEPTTFGTESAGFGHFARPQSGFARGKAGGFGWTVCLARTLARMGVWRTGEWHYKIMYILASANMESNGMTFRSSGLCGTRCTSPSRYVTVSLSIYINARA